VGPQTHPTPDRAEHETERSEIEQEVAAIIAAWKAACPEAPQIALERIQHPHLRLVKS
jgi:hypothetical protein